MAQRTPYRLSRAAREPVPWQRTRSPRGTWLRPGSSTQGPAGHGSATVGAPHPRLPRSVQAKPAAGGVLGTGGERLPIETVLKQICKGVLNYLM
ncbi:hypothetical protein FOCC_FOCC014067 [Frankliniella occidentalis]|nr:hypothetical protein FOCC_FOCC014067 [Frankliniella occidentalis]